MSLLLERKWDVINRNFDYENTIDFTTSIMFLYGGQSEHLYTQIIPTVQLDLSNDVEEKGVLTLHFKAIDNERTRYWNHSPDFPPDFSISSPYTITKGPFIVLDFFGEKEMGYKLELANPVTPNIPREAWSGFTYMRGIDVYKKTIYYSI